MPSGYTSDLYDGKEVDFPTFVLKCARAFGATVLLRDSSIDVLPTEDNITEGDYAKRSLDECKDRLDHFLSMDEAELIRLTEEANKNTQTSLDESLAKNRRLIKAYTEMIVRVEAWTPPTDDHAPLKEFMLEQLNNSLQHDCDENEDDIRKWYRIYTPDQYRAEMIQGAARGIERHAKQVVETDERNEGRKKWVRELYESLGLKETSHAS